MGGDQQPEPSGVAEPPEPKPLPRRKLLVPVDDQHGARGHSAAPEVYRQSALAIVQGEADDRAASRSDAGDKRFQQRRLSATVRAEHLAAPSRLLQPGEDIGQGNAVRKNEGYGTGPDTASAKGVTVPGQGFKRGPGIDTHTAATLAGARPALLAAVFECPLAEAGLSGGRSSVRSPEGRTAGTVPS